MLIGRRTILVLFLVGNALTWGGLVTFVSC
jgi:hypothetical protein